MITPTPINTPKSILLKAKTLIKRAIKEKIDHANKINLNLAILNLQITLSQKPRSNDPIHQTKDQKFSLIKNLLQEICKNENEEIGQLQIQILL